MDRTVLCGHFDKVCKVLGSGLSSALPVALLISVRMVLKSRWGGGGGGGAGGNQIKNQEKSMDRII